MTSKPKIILIAVLFFLISILIGYTLGKFPKSPIMVIEIGKKDRLEEKTTTLFLEIKECDSEHGNLEIYRNVANNYVILCTAYPHAIFRKEIQIK